MSGVWEQGRLATLTLWQILSSLTPKVVLTARLSRVQEQILTSKREISSYAEVAELLRMQVCLMVAISTLKARFWLLSPRKIAILLLMPDRPKVVGLMSMSPMFSGLQQSVVNRFEVLWD